MNIKKALRSKGMTIKKLSEVSGVPLNTLYSITKRDSNRIDKVILSKICYALDVLPIDLVDNDSFTHPSPNVGTVFAGKKNAAEKVEMLDGFGGYDENGLIVLAPGSVAESVFMAEGFGIEDSVYRKYKLDLAFGRLSEVGQQEAIKRVEELAEIPRYRLPELLEAAEPNKKPKME